MKQIYQDEEFEQFLQDSVKQHRIYPSDHIWKNIRTQIHGYRAWPALTFISLFVITALTLSTLLNNHPDAHLSPEALAGITESNNLNALHRGTAISAGEKNKQYFQQTAPERIREQTFAQAAPEAQQQEDLFVPVTPMRDVAATTVRVATNSEKAGDRSSRRNLARIQQVDPVPADLEPSYSFVNTSSAEAIAPAVEHAAIEKETVDRTTENKKTEAHATADEFLKDFGFVGNVEPRNKNSKFGFQFYVTPSTSYRRLSDEKMKEIVQPAAVSAAAQSVPSSLSNVSDVNDVVRHRPAMGLEIGFNMLYNMTNKLKFKTGLQLNVRQYYIETFQSSNDLTSLSLINLRGVETISFYSQYNNNTGYKKTQLDNRIYQVAIPLGIQWDVMQGKHLGLNAEASVQPTLTLNTNTYLLSSDYKHYTSGSDLMRKWNINTSAGFNITYKQGSLLYTFGPQVRYQHLPTYSNLYPVKEYLIDYGIRFGITKQLK